MNTKRLFYAAFAIMTAAVTGCSTPTEKIRDFDHLSGKKIVVQEGTTFDEILTEQYPQYSVVRVPTFFGIYRALVSGEAEYGIDEDISSQMIISGGLSIDTTFTNMPAVPMGAIFNKNNTDLQAQFNTFLAELEHSGQLAEIRNKWFSTTSPTSIPVPVAKYTEGTPLVAVIEGDYPPFNLMVGANPSGLDAELATMFANYLQRPLTMTRMNFSELIPCIESGKADFCISGISLTDERKEKVLFSNPYNHTHTVIVSLQR